MTDIERYEPQAPMGGNPAHVRLGINQIAVVANYFSESGLFKTGRPARSMTPQECFAIIMAGQALGVGPMPSMMSFHLIEGKPEMSANLQAYFIKSSGKYDYRAVHLREGGKVVACRVDIIDTRTGEVIGESLFGEAEAKAAGLASGTNYQKYAPNMYFARAITNAIAFHCPDAVPFRIYGEGEIGGQGPSAGTAGVQAVEGEGPISTTKVEAMVDRVVAATTEPEEVIQDADVEVEQPAVEQEEEPRFSAAAVETRLRQDLPKLNPEQKLLIKATIVKSRLPWGYASIVKHIVAAGYSDVFSWLRSLEGGSQAASPANTPLGTSPVTPVPQSTGEDEEGPPAGVTGRQTGSQTQATISDAQVRLFNAKCSEAGLSDAERKFVLKHYGQVDSSRSIPKADFDDMLAVLKDIAEGSPETRRIFLGDQT